MSNKRLANLETLANPKGVYVLLRCQQTFAKVCKLCQRILLSPQWTGH